MPWYIWLIILSHFICSGIILIGIYQIHKDITKKNQFTLRKVDLFKNSIYTTLCKVLEVIIMFEWFRDNLSFILAIISLVSILLNIIILLVKKIPINRIMKVVSMVPSLISQAEKLFLISESGSRKKDIVKSLYDKLLDDYGISKYGKYIDIDNLIEEILDTPTKKGD